VRELFGEDVEVRKRAADVARRITEQDGSLLEPYADELAGLLEMVEKFLWDGTLAMKSRARHVRRRLEKSRKA
jgi:hypothetical protein